MLTIDSIFQAFGGTTAFATALDIKQSAASEMRRRGSIPVRHWPRLVRVAGERGIEGVDNDTLVRIHAGEATAVEA